MTVLPILVYLLIGTLFAIMMCHNIDNYGYGAFVILFWPLMAVVFLLVIIRAMIKVLGDSQEDEDSDPDDTV